MNDEMNGNSAESSDPRSQALAAANNILNQITPLIRPPMQTTVRGCITGFSNVAPDLIMKVCAFELGLFCGQAINADISTVLRFRAELKAAFEDGLKRAPLLQAPGGQWQPPKTEA